MKKTSLVLLCAVILGLRASGQDIYSATLDEIASHSLAICNYSRAYEASQTENLTGLAPVNPEVEFGYLWGNKLTGNRKDVSVKQEFDFPSVYGKRRNLADLKNSEASYLFKTQRLGVLLQAKELLVQLIYYNALYELVAQQCGYMQNIVDAFEKLRAKGEVTVIDYNKAAINLTAVENELARVGMERKDIVLRLEAANGGCPVKFDYSKYPSIAVPADFESWYKENEENNPSLQYLKSQVDVSRGNMELVKKETLPKFSVGYTGEFVRGSNFQGITVGVSVPLWENRNKVRHSQARTLAAEEALRAAHQEYYTDLQSLFFQIQTLGEMEQKYSDRIDKSSSDQVLRTALEKGLINVHEYFEELQYSYSMREILLSTQRDRNLALARLYAFAL